MSEFNIYQLLFMIQIIGFGYTLYSCRSMVNDVENFTSIDMETEDAMRRYAVVLMFEPSMHEERKTCGVPCDVLVNFYYSDGQYFHSFITGRDMIIYKSDVEEMEFILGLSDADESCLFRMNRFIAFLPRLNQLALHTERIVGVITIVVMIVCSSVFTDKIDNDDAIHQDVVPCY